MRVLRLGALAATLLAVAPQSTIQPSAVPLRAVLQAYRQALGVNAPGRGDTRVLHWSVTFGDLTGTSTEIYSGNDEREDTNLGPLHTADGTIGGQNWSMNENGEVVIEQNIHREEDVDDDAFHAAVGPSGAVSLVGYMTQPLNAYVVKVDPPGGVLEYYYIDRQTWMLDARATHEHGHSVLVTYDDYRTMLGVPVAWHVHVSIDDGMQEEDYRLQDATFGVPIDPSQFAIPASANIVTLTAPRVTLPAKIVDDEVVVTAQLGSRPVNLVLDSGSAGIAVDDAVVKALGYPEYGRVLSETAGTYSESSAIVPSMTIGSIAMQNVRVSSLPFAAMPDEHTPVAGLLGFDFLDCVVVHIDYADGNVEVIDPATFTPPPGAVSLPIALDDEVPAVAASLGPVADARFIVDTGASRSVIFSMFASAHPDAVADRGLGAELEAEFPFFSAFEGVGGAVEYRPVQTGPLTVGAWTFPRWLFDVTQDPSKFEIEDYSGLLGQDLLRYYDLYLDYPHGRLLLVPNARYTGRFGS